MEKFLAGTVGRVNAESGPTDQPIQLHQNMLDYGRQQHEVHDSWLPPEGVELIQIAGWGVSKTVSGIEYSFIRQRQKVEPKIKFTVDGDGTVRGGGEAACEILHILVHVGRSAAARSMGYKTECSRRHPQPVPADW